MLRHVTDKSESCDSVGIRARCSRKIGGGEHLRCFAKPKTTVWVANKDSSLTYSAFFRTTIEPSLPSLSEASHYSLTSVFVKDNLDKVSLSLSLARCLKNNNPHPSMLLNQKLNISLELPYTCKYHKMIITS